MGTQVTLTIPDTLFDRARQIAKESQRDVADVLAEFAILGENRFEERMLPEEPDVLDEEEAAFIAMHPTLREQHLGEYVAVYGGAVVDHDADLTALSQRLWQRFGNEAVLVTPVKEEPIEEWLFRSPRFVREE